MLIENIYIYTLFYFIARSEAHLVFISAEFVSMNMSFLSLSLRVSVLYG